MRLLQPLKAALRRRRVRPQHSPRPMPAVEFDNFGRRTISWPIEASDGTVIISHQYPDALQHHYAPAGTGEAVPLYAGVFSVDGDEGYLGDVRYRWGRTPRIEFQGVRPTHDSDLKKMMRSLGSEARWLPASTLGIGMADGRIPPQPSAATEPEASPRVGSHELSGPVDQAIGTPQSLTHVTFMVPNGWDGHDGRGICDPADLMASWFGRTVAEGDGWRVTFDQVREMSSEAWKELNEKDGYRFTHVGRLDRLDGATFDGHAALEVLDRVRLGLNLALGRRTTCALPVGWADEKPVWSRWRRAPVDSCESSSHWLDYTIACQQVSQSVSLMLDYTADEANLAAVRPALAYYVAANVDVDVELSVAIPVSALQLLGYYRFVEKQGQFSKRQWHELSTEQQVRKLLEDISLTLSVPPHFSALHESPTAPASPICRWPTASRR